MTTPKKSTAERLVSARTSFIESFTVLAHQDADALAANPHDAFHRAEALLREAAALRRAHLRHLGLLQRRQSRLTAKSADLHAEIQTLVSTVPA